MAELADAGTRLHECPTCRYLTPVPVVFDQPPVCVNCLQGEWPEDPKPKSLEYDPILVLAAAGLLIAAVLALVNLGYL